MRIPCKRKKQNAPGYGDPRAFALPREIGVTDLRERDQSMVGQRPSNACFMPGTHKPGSRLSGDISGMIAMGR